MKTSIKDGYILSYFITRAN